VAFASRHGSTDEIARAIASELEVHSLEATVGEAGAVDSLEPFDAVVLGSAVYMGAWL